METPEGPAAGGQTTERSVNDNHFRKSLKTMRPKPNPNLCCLPELPPNPRTQRRPLLPNMPSKCRSPRQLGDPEPVTRNLARLGCKEASTSEPFALDVCSAVRTPPLAHLDGPVCLHLACEPGDYRFQVVSRCADMVHLMPRLRNSF